MEDLLWQKCGKGLGFDTSKSLQSDKERDDFLKKIRGHIKGFHGKLPRKDPNNLESPIEFETYRQSVTSTKCDIEKTIEGVQSLKLKMQWQIKVAFGGREKIFKADQYIKTGSYVPDKDIVTMRTPQRFCYAKHTALLRIKIIRNLYKSVFLGEEKEAYDEQLTQNLRAPDGLNITHYPNLSAYSLGPYTSFNQSFGRVLASNQHALKPGDGPAYYSIVQFQRDRKKMTVCYTSPFGAPGRTQAKHFNSGDKLPDGSEVDKPGYHFHKVMNMHLVEQKRWGEVMEYNEHLYNQASRSLIIEDGILIDAGPLMSDIESNAYKNLVQFGTKDIKEQLQSAQKTLEETFKKELQGKQYTFEKLPQLNALDWETYAKSYFKFYKEELEKTNNVLKHLRKRKNFFRSQTKIQAEVEKFKQLTEKSQENKESLKKEYESVKTVHVNLKNINVYVNNLEGLRDQILALATYLAPEKKVGKSAATSYDKAIERGKKISGYYQILSEQLEKAEEFLKKSG